VAPDPANATRIDRRPMTDRRRERRNYAVRLPGGTPGRARPAHAVAQASELFCQNILQDVLAQAQVRNQLLEPLLLDQLQMPQLSNADPPYTFF
jgi:hypothetical protein